MKSRLLSLLVVAMILFSSFLLTGCTTNEAIELSNSLVEEGKNLYEQREYKQAVEKFGEALEEYPVNFDAYLGIISILLEKGHFGEAENVADEAAIRVDNEDAAALYFDIGKGYYKNRDFENAENMYKEALERDKSFYKAKVGLAEVKIQTGDLEQAKKELNSIGGRSREKAEVLLLGAYLTLDDWARGMEIVNKIDVGEIPDEETKERVRLLKEIYESEELEKDELYKNTYLAKEYINTGYPYLAIEIFEKQADSVEEYWDAQYFWGRAYFDYGDYDMAIEKLNNAVALDVDDSKLFLLLGRAYLMRDNIDRSLRFYERAVALTTLPDDRDVLREYLNVLVENNMLNSARTKLLELIADDEYPWMYVLLVELSYLQNNFAQMNEYLETLESYTDLATSEEKGFLKYKLLYLSEMDEESERIVETIEKYKNLDKYDPEIFLLEGKYFVSRQESAEAKESLNRAVELDMKGEITDEARKILATIK